MTTKQRQAVKSYEGYLIPIRQLRTRLFAAQRTLKGVMARQGRLLETMAINELDLRRKRLEEYQVKARFALAESYDRATKAEEENEILKQNKLRGESESLKDSDPANEDNKSAQSEKTDEVEGAVEDVSYDEQLSFKEKLTSY